MLRVRNALKKKRSCGTPSIGFRICSARGRCWSSVPDQGATTCCAQCLHQFFHVRTSPRCGHATGHAVPPASFPGAHSNNRLRVSWHHCQCAWRVWVFVRELPLSGHLGPMPCRCSKSGCPSLLLRLSWTCSLIQLAIWESCKKHPTCWTIVVSLGVQHGKTCVKSTKRSPMSGRTVGRVQCD